MQNPSMDAEYSTQSSCTNADASEDSWDTLDSSMRFICKSLVRMWADVYKNALADSPACVAYTVKDDDFKNLHFRPYWKVWSAIHPDVECLDPIAVWVPRPSEWFYESHDFWSWMKTEHYHSAKAETGTQCNLFIHDKWAGTIMIPYVRMSGSDDIISSIDVKLGPKQCNIRELTAEDAEITAEDAEITFFRPYIDLPQKIYDSDDDDTRLRKVFMYIWHFCYIWSNGRSAKYRWGDPEFLRCKFTTTVLTEKLEQQLAHADETRISIENEIASQTNKIFAQYPITLKSLDELYKLDLNR